MSIRYTLRHLKEQDCTPDNMKKYEIVATDDTNKIMFRMASGSIKDITSASAEYATQTAQGVIAKAEAWEKTIDAFNYNGAELLTEAQGYSTAAKASEDKAFNYQTNASEYKDKAEEWAQSTESPDKAADTESATGESQSSRTWALASKASATAGAASATAAAESATAASGSATAAAGSATAAADSATAASQSATNAKASEDNSKTSETNAGKSYTDTKALFDNTTKHTIVVTYEDNTTETINILGVNS